MSSSSNTNSPSKQKNPYSVSVISTNKILPHKGDKDQLNLNLAIEETTLKSIKVYSRPKNAYANDFSFLLLKTLDEMGDEEREDFLTHNYPDGNYPKSPSHVTQVLDESILEESMKPIEGHNVNQEK